MATVRDCARNLHVAHRAGAGGDTEFLYVKFYEATTNDPLCRKRKAGCRTLCFVRVRVLTLLFGSLLPASRSENINANQSSLGRVAQRIPPLIFIT